MKLTPKQREKRMRRGKKMLNEEKKSEAWVQ